MTFLRRFGFLALSVVALGFAGCQKSSVINIPPPPPAQLYVANFLSQQVNSFSRPITPASSPNTTLHVASAVDGVASDSAGNLYVPNTGVIYVYKQPITATTVPTTYTITGAVNMRGLNFDNAGNLWVTDAGSNQVFELKAPFTASPVAPTRTIQCACFAFPIEVTTDIGNHLFVGNNGTGIVQVLNIPAVTGVSLLTPVATLTSPTGSALGLATDVTGHLFVTEDNNQSIMVYNPPFGTGNLPQFTISNPGFVDINGAESCGLPAQLHFDTSGALYVAYQTDSSVAPTGCVALFTAPYSGGSVASIVLQGATSGLTNPVDEGFAP